VDVTPYLPEFRVAPGATVPVPLFLNSTQSFKQDLGMRVGELPQGWTYRLSAETVALPGYKGRLVVVSLTAPQDATEGARAVEVFAGDTRATVRLNVTQPGEAVPADAAVRVTLVHLDANGTVLGASAPDALSPGLKVAPGASLSGLPIALFLGEGDAPNGTRPAGPALRQALSGARVGDVLLVETAAEGDPVLAEAPAGGARLLVRVDGLLAAGGA
jgi:hypothetical protein